MKKIFFTSIFLFLTHSHADYLNTNNNRCVYNLTPNQSTGWCYTNRFNDKTRCNKNAKFDDFINGFYRNDQGQCIMFEDLQKTGMSYSQFQFQQALLANMYAFFIFFLVGFIFTLQGRR